MAETTIAAPRRLADFIRDRHHEILARWEQSVRRMRPARDLTRPALLDHIPEFLRALAEFVGKVREGEPAQPDEQLPAIHAIERLDVGYDLSDVVLEYSLLRRCIVELVATKAGVPASRSAEMPRMHEAIDAAIAASVTHYSRARERTLKALDRISTAALGTNDIANFLPKTLAVLRDTTASVDAVSILLVEGDQLVVQAAVGAAQSPDESRPLARGECFAGRVWSAGQPLMIRDAANDPAVTTNTIHKQSTRALYGVPLEFGHHIIGVAMMGSSTAHEFSKEDLLLFRTAVSRSAALIAHARLEREREEERARLEAVLRVLPVGVVIAEASGALVQGNAEYERIWGRMHEAASIDGYSAYEGYRTDGTRIGPHDWPMARALEHGETTSDLELQIVCADGSRRVVVAGAAPIRDDSGNIVAGVATLVDITERKRDEQKLREALDFRDDVLSVLSHDLRQPLGVIGTSAQLLLRKEGLEQYASIFSRQIRNVDRIDRMIKDLLDYARARQGTGIPVRRQHADMVEIVKQVIDSMHTLHPDRQIRLDAPKVCDGDWDVDRMLQVFGNLLANAVAYSPKDAPIDVKLDCNGEVTCAVHNGGAAIPPDKLPHIFEPFRRGAASGNPSGLGLGLYIVKQIVEAHGGSVSVRSIEGDGTTFELRLPRKAADA